MKKRCQKEKRECKEKEPDGKQNMKKKGQIEQTDYRKKKIEYEE